MLSGEPGATGAGLLGPVRGDSGFYTRDPRHNPRRVIIDYTRPSTLRRTVTRRSVLRSKPAAGIACPA